MQNQKSSTKERFNKVTAQRLKAWYKERLIQTTLYILQIKELCSRPGTAFVIPNVKDFCKEWGISDSTFYRAISKLQSDGVINFESTAGIRIIGCEEKIIDFPCQADSQSASVPQAGHNSHERDTDIYKERARKDLSDLSDLSDSTGERDFIDWLIRQHSNTRNPRAYVRKILENRDDAKYWKEQYEIDTLKRKENQRLRTPEFSLSVEPKSLEPQQEKTEQEIRQNKIAMLKGRLKTPLNPAKRLQTIQELRDLGEDIMQNQFELSVESIA